MLEREISFSVLLVLFDVGQAGGVIELFKESRASSRCYATVRPDPEASALICSCCTAWMRWRMSGCGPVVSLVIAATIGKASSWSFLVICLATYLYLPWNREFSSVTSSEFCISLRALGDRRIAGCLIYSFSWRLIGGVHHPLLQAEVIIGIVGHMPTLKYFV